MRRCRSRPVWLRHGRTATRAELGPGAPPRYGRPVNEPGEIRPSGQRARTTHRVDTVTAPAVGLAVWVASAEHAELVAAVDKRLEAGPGSATLGDVRLELDAAAVRSRWFDPPQAATLRRIAGMSPDAVALRLAPAERQALLDECDLSPAVRRTVVGPPAPLPPTSARRPPAEPSSRGCGGEPVALLTEQGGALTWMVGVAEEGGVLAWHASANEPIWTAAWQASGRLPVEVDEVAGARRLVTPCDPKLATAALARADLRDIAADTALLLSLPQTVVLAPALLAGRVALHAYPTPVRLLPVADLPPFPLPLR